METDWDKIRWARSVIEPPSPIKSKPRLMVDAHAMAKLRFLIDQIGDLVGDVAHCLEEGTDYKKNPYDAARAVKQLWEIVDLTEIDPGPMEKNLESLRWSEFKLYLDDQHVGDCTACPATCMRCWIEQFYEFDTHPKNKAEGWKAFNILTNHRKQQEEDPMYKATSDAMRICDDYRFWARENRDRIRDLNKRIEEVSKEEYRDWVHEWRKEYKWLSAVIRAMKGARKEFRYEYRTPGQTEVKARTKVGPNPNHHPKATWHLSELRATANDMMLARTRSKERYKEMRETEDA